MTFSAMEGTASVCQSKKKASCEQVNGTKPTRLAIFFVFFLNYPAPAPTFSFKLHAPPVQLYRNKSILSTYEQN